MGWQLVTTKCNNTTQHNYSNRDYNLYFGTTHDSGYPITVHKRDVMLLQNTNKGE